MSLLHFDGFDYYRSEDIGKIYSVTGTPTIDTSVYKTGRAALKFTSVSDNFIYKEISASSNVIVGFAIRVDSLPASTVDLIEFRTGSAGLQLKLSLRSDGNIEVFRGTTSLGTTSSGISAASWKYVEAKVYINSTAGTVDIKIENTSVLSLTGQNTRNDHSLNTVEQVYFRSVVSSTYYDDVYICNTSGTVNNGFLGKVAVITLYPNSDGTYKSAVGSDGDSVNNYQMVDETPVDTTDYISITTTSDKASFGFTDTDAEVTAVKGVKLNSVAQMNVSGVRAIRPFLRVSGTDYEGSDAYLDDAIEIIDSHLWETNPNTASLWNIAEVEAAEGGIVVSV